MDYYETIINYIIEVIYNLLSYFNINIDNLVKNNKNLTVLEITNKDIDYEFSQYITKRINTSILKELCIIITRLNEIDRNGIINIFEAIKNNKNILIMYIHMNLGYLELDCISEIIKNGKLNTLHLIGPLMIDYLYEALKNNKTIVNLTLSFNNMNENDFKLISNILKKNDTLENLCLLGNHLTENGCKYLSDALKFNKSLKKLNLRRCNYIKGIELNNYLTHLNLNGNKIDINYIADLIKNNKTLKYLDLSFNEIINDQLIYIRDALKINKSLIQLNLSNNYISNLGIIYLFNGLIKNKTLRYLYLNNNKIKNDIFNFIHDAIQLTGLILLDLRGTKIVEEDIKKINQELNINLQKQIQIKQEKIYLILFLDKGNIISRDIQRQFLEFIL